jgi:hypothetical protein
MDLLEEAEAMVANLQKIVRAEIEQAKEDWDKARKPNTDRLRALGMIS